MDSAPARRARTAAAGRRPRALQGTAAGALALLCLRSLAACFVAPRPLGEPARAPDVALGAGFGDVEAPAPKKKTQVRRSSAVKQEDLEKDHGDMWQAVDSIFSGQKAESPEVIMRARFTALKFKDPNFLAATEVDADKRELKERADQWATTLGMKEQSPFDWLVRVGESTGSLTQAQSFEVVSASGNWVEFKIRCGDGKTLHEKSRFQEDKKWGYVYSGESEFGNWE